MTDTPTALAPAHIDFALLPDVLRQNQELTQRAVTSMDATLQSLPNNLKELNILTGDKIESELNDLRQRGIQAAKLNTERRMIYTKQFDEIKSLCTGYEKEIIFRVDRLKKWSDVWNTEKSIRIKEEEKKKQLSIDIENAKIDLKRRIQESFHLEYLKMRDDYITRMNRAFNNCTLDTIDTYVHDLKNFITPPIENMNPGFSPSALLTDSEMNEIYASVKMPYLPRLSGSFIEAVEAEKSRLIELAPSRKAELVRIQNDAAEAKKAYERIANEEVERKAKAEQEEAERKATLEQEANVEKLNAALESAAAAPAVELSKGTQVKMKYSPTSHKEMIAVIQWWVANCMNLLTVDELSKKFSFMLTAANKELNKGTAINGVATVEDISTRTSKK